MKNLLFLIALLCCSLVYSQTKVSGMVVDEDNDPVAFANVFFKDTTVGTITNEDGRFYLESESGHTVLVVSFIGYQPEEVELEKRVTYELTVVLTQGEQLDEVIVYSGKQPKKNNPAIDILKKIWARKKFNGLKTYAQYQYDKYEKVQFDLNSIDSAMMQSKMFKGMEFVFKDMDTSRITGKTFLPLFLNETFSKVYGSNELGLEKEDVLGNKNSGFSQNQAIIGTVEELYSDYDVYDNYLKFFDKSFTSPLSTTGVDVYNYVLSDSAYIDNKWCYHIIYYPRRKNELTFKGDFWVNDTTYAVKRINLEVTKSANINWVKDIYIEQDFEVVNDSVFLLKRNYMLSDFSLTKKEKSKGVYSKRTTIYDNHDFETIRPEAFYRSTTDPYNPAILNREDAFWESNRLEQLNEKEQGIYALIDTLVTVPKFRTYYNIVSILGSGYIEIDKWNLDIGDIYSIFGYNDAEGVRLRGGARTYFDQNDPWRLQGYLAYGFLDKKVKHGFSAKFLLDRRSRLIISGGNRRDIEQLGLNLNATTDVLGRSVASGAVLTVGNNNRLSNINLSTLGLEAEPLNNLRMRFGGTFKTLRSALPEEFNLDYVDPDSPTGVSSEVRQFELMTSLIYTPGREIIGYGVEPRIITDTYSTLLLNYTVGLDDFLNSDFNYQKLQFSYTQPWQIGGFGRLWTTVEAGKIFGEVPLGLLNVIPGNQTLFTMYTTFPNLNFYEFVTDEYLAVHMEHHFNGRIFSRIPILRKLNLREIVGLRGAWGRLSDENIALSAPTNIPLIAPTDEIYWEYSLGIGNIFKIFRLDFNWRGNYLDNQDARKFRITGTFGFHF